MIKRTLRSIKKYHFDFELSDFAKTAMFLIATLGTKANKKPVDYSTFTVIIHTSRCKIKTIRSFKSYKNSKSMRHRNLPGKYILHDFNFLRG